VTPGGNGAAGPPKDLSQAMFRAMMAAEAKLNEEGFEPTCVVIHFVVEGEGEQMDYVAATGKPADLDEMTPRHREIMAHSLGLTIDDMRGELRT
jgi:hypothetical protein